MGLKYKIAKLDDVAENLRSLYKAEGDAFILDADGIVPKERVDEFRTNNIQLQQALDKLKDVDPVKYAELIKLDKDVQEGKLIKEGKLEEVVNLRVGEMRRTLEATNTQLNNQLTAANAQLSVVLIDNAVKTSALKSGIASTAVDDVVLRARGIYTVKDGTPVPQNAKGEVIYGKDGTTPMPMDDWVKGLKETAPHLFVASSGSGAGGGRSTGQPDLSKMSAVDKINMGISQGGLMGKLPMEGA